MMMKIKICGLPILYDALACSAAGVDMIGIQLYATNPHDELIIDLAAQLRTHSGERPLEPALDMS